METFPSPDRPAHSCLPDVLRLSGAGGALTPEAAEDPTVGPTTTGACRPLGGAVRRLAAAAVRVDGERRDRGLRGS